MIVVLKRECPQAEIDQVLAALTQFGVQPRLIHSGARTLVAVEGDCCGIDRSTLGALHAVEMVVPTVGASPASFRAPLRDRHAIAIGPGGAVIGSDRLAIIAGPCSIEDEERLLLTAETVKAAGAVGLRGGAFKPRSNPHTFQGLGERGLQMMAKAREKTGLAVVTEVMAPEQVEMVGSYADLLQIGTRNMHNTNLLTAVGRQSKPVLLKRGWSATLDEWLHAAEYIINEGNPDVVLCERGIRTFETHVRNTLPLASVPAVKYRSPLPIIVDPSQGTGVADYVAPLSRAAIACGADGLLIEVHPDPLQAVTDGDQTIDFAAFQSLMRDLHAIAEAVGRTL